MAKAKIYAGLEIGTSKICVVVGEVDTDGSIKILGIGQAPSRGVRKGEIVDFETAQTCLHDALVQQVEAVCFVIAAEADDGSGRVGEPLVVRVHAQLGIQHTASIRSKTKG